MRGEIVGNINLFLNLIYLSLGGFSLRKFPLFLYLCVLFFYKLLLLFLLLLLLLMRTGNPVTEERNSGVQTRLSLLGLQGVWKGMMEYPQNMQFSAGHLVSQWTTSSGSSPHMAHIGSMPGSIMAAYARRRLQ